ncbi:MAG: family 10 glycosylhydrolase [Oscillospiraceae bacterium]
MDRAIKIVSLLAAFLLFASCTGIKTESDSGGTPTNGQDIFSEQLGVAESEDNPRREIVCAVWISYIDIAEMVTADKKAFDEQLVKVTKNLLSIGVSDIYLQVRAFGETLYTSELFPSSELIYSDQSKEIDYLKCFIDAAHSAKIRLHAWVNPYRLGDITSSGYAVLAERLRALDEFAIVTDPDGGSYINPASDPARDAIIEDITALCTAYDIDGVQFDDYFYPSDDTEIDERQYTVYKESGGQLELEAWRRENVSSLVRGVCEAVHASGEDRVFGVSPDASIERNQSRHFADVQKWCTQSGFVDYICPQIYYGYANQTRPFTSVLAEWKELCTSCDLVVGLSAYKAGMPDAFAGSGSAEWQENFDIISRQYAEVATDSEISGVAIFRYGSFFNPAQETSAFANLELYELRKTIDKER